MAKVPFCLVFVHVHSAKHHIKEGNVEVFKSLQFGPFSFCSKSCGVDLNPVTSENLHCATFCSTSYRSLLLCIP